MRKPDLGSYPQDYDWQDVQIGEWVYWPDSVGIQDAWIIETELEANCFVGGRKTLWKLNWQWKDKDKNHEARWTMIRRKGEDELPP